MEGLGEGAPTAAKGPAAFIFSPELRDVVSALVNLGCQTAAAEAAVKKAAGGALRRRI